ncbi:hypothetical protein HZA98_01790 [Candidatus Woesearchaeota archaeon]|nr:hypothetical protein [Candidatus Woesearchaeota archaeon]
MKMLNTKGMDISLNFIILAALALITLIIIALFFTGGLTNLFKQQEEVGSISSEKVALYTSKCNFYCTTSDQQSWDQAKTQFPKEVVDAYPGVCEQLTAKTYAADCVSKSGIQAAQ